MSMLKIHEGTYRMIIMNPGLVRKSTARSPLLQISKLSVENKELRLKDFDHGVWKSRRKEYQVLPRRQAVR